MKVKGKKRAHCLRDDAAGMVPDASQRSGPSMSVMRVSICCSLVPPKSAPPARSSYMMQPADQMSISGP
jgi:hypothetical protein